MRLDTRSKTSTNIQPMSGFIAKDYAYRIFATYCLIFYFVPFLLFMVNGNPLEQTLLHRPNYILGVLYAVFAFLLFTLSLKLPSIRLPNYFRGISRIAFGSRWSLTFAIFFLVFSIATRSVMGLSFRQTGDALADVGNIAFVLQFLKLYFGVAILVHYRMLRENPEDQRRSISLVLIGLGFIFSIQAAYDVLYIFAALAASGFKWRRLLGLHIKAVRRFSIIFLPVVVLLAGYVGVANKTGSEEALRLILGTDYLLTIISTRLGYPLYNTSMYVSEHFTSFFLFPEAVQNIMGTFKYRASILLGIDGVAKPEVVSIARMNFLFITTEWSARTGASPSMLGSVFYMPGAGFAIFYHIFILRGIATMIGQIMGEIGRNPLFILTSMAIFASTVDAFLDNLNPLGTGAIRVFFVFLGMVFIRITVKHRRNS